MRLRFCFLNIPITRATISFLVVLVMMSVLVPAAKAQDTLELAPADNTLAPDTERKGTLPRLTIDEEDDDPADILETIAQLPEEIQHELMAEGDKAFQTCTMNITLSSNYDCSCYALKLIEVRFNEGPEPAFTSLIQNMDIRPCVHDALVAGNFYQRCMGLAVRSEDDLDVQDSLCRCVVDEMVTFMERYGNMPVRIINRNFSDNYQRCYRDTLLSGAINTNR